jgi:hypothetical protein
VSAAEKKSDTSTPLRVTFTWCSGTVRGTSTRISASPPLTWSGALDSTEISSTFDPPDPPLWAMTGDATDADALNASASASASLRVGEGSGAVLRRWPAVLCCIANPLCSGRIPRRQFQQIPFEGGFTAVRPSRHAVICTV